MKVKDLLSIPNRWTKGSEAKDDYNRSVPVTAPSAVQFCLLGATKKCYPDWTEQAVALKKLRAALLLRVGHEGLEAFNDAKETTHADVLAVLQAANV